MFGRAGADDWEAGHLEELAREWCEASGTPLKEIAMPLRFALSGRKVSPGVFEIAALMGREECARRLAHYKFTDAAI
jgi:glutamyl-tRNA synthetase